MFFYLSCILLSFVTKGFFSFKYGLVWSQNYKMGVRGKFTNMDKMIRMEDDF